MPTYEYECLNGHHFEKIQKISDRTRPRCPDCGGVATRRISGGAGLVFKGSGFYITDYGKDGKGPRKDPADKPDKPAADAKPAKVEGGPEAKPAAKESAPAKKAAE